jgi:hypothetical protein
MELTELQVKTIAATIVDQIGSKAFCMMGASLLTHSIKNGLATLSFKIGTNPKKITHITVSYDSGKDTYVVCFLRIRSLPISENTKEDVYSDQLNSVIEDGTGLFLSL